jgi:hypothetical protein
MISTTHLNTANVSLNGLTDRSGQKYYARRNIAMPAELEELDYECQDRAADAMPPLAHFLAGRAVNGMAKDHVVRESDDRDTNKHSNDSDNESHCTFGNPNAELILSQDGGMSQRSMATPKNVCETGQITPAENLTDNQYACVTNKTSFITDGSCRQMEAEQSVDTLDHNQLDEAVMMFRDIQSKLKPHVYEQALKRLACQLEADKHIGCHDASHEEIVKENEKLKSDYLELLNKFVEQKKHHAEAIADLQQKFLKLTEEYSPRKPKDISNRTIEEVSMSMEKSGMSSPQKDQSYSKNQLYIEDLAGETIEEIDLTCQRENAELSRNNITYLGHLINETPRSVSENFESLRQVLTEGHHVHMPKRFEFPKQFEEVGNDQRHIPKIENNVNTVQSPVTIKPTDGHEALNNQPHQPQNHQVSTQKISTTPTPFRQVQTTPAPVPSNDQSKVQHSNPNINHLLSPISTPRASNLPEVAPINTVSYQRPHQQSEIHSIRSITHYVGSKDNLGLNTQNTNKTPTQAEPVYRSSQTGTSEHRGKVVRISINDYSPSVRNFSSHTSGANQTPSTHHTTYQISPSQNVTSTPTYISQPYSTVIHAPVESTSTSFVNHNQFYSNANETPKRVDGPTWRQKNLFLESERNLEPFSPQNTMTFHPRGTFGRQCSPSFSPNRMMTQNSPYANQINSTRVVQERVSESDWRQGEVRRLSSLGNGVGEWRVSNNSYESRNGGNVFRFTNNN